VILVAGAALVGLPLTSGFISKWVLLEAALDKNMIVMAFVILMASLLTAIYVGKLVQRMFFAPSDGKEVRHDAPLMMLAPAMILAALTIYFGIDTRLPLDLSTKAAELLLSSPNPANLIVLPK
jgi:multicomponent Na+:H+ antiporter subunit D